VVKASEQQEVVCHDFTVEKLLAGSFLPLMRVCNRPEADIGKRPLPAKWRPSMALHHPY